MSPQPCDWVPLGATTVHDGQVGIRDRSGRTAPVSGRVTALVADPAAPDTHLYAGTALGGVWETKNGGQTWATLHDSDGQATLAVGALALDGGTLYIGTGEANRGGDNLPGLGLLLYNVASNTFTQDFAPHFLDTVISAIIVAPGSHLFVGTSNGLWEKVGAAAWAEVPVAGVPGRRITDLVFDTTGGYLWVGVLGHGVFVRHPVSGAVVRPPETVARLPQPGVGIGVARVKLAQCAQHPATLYVAFEQPGVAPAPATLQIFRCSDGPTAAPANAAAPIPSSTWAPTAATPNPVAQLFYNLVLGVHPRDPQYVYFGADGLFRSGDGGANWQPVHQPTPASPGLHSDQHALVVQDGAVTAGSFAGIALWLGNDGGVWRSSDGGTVWSHRNRGLNTMQYFCVASHPDVPTVAVAGAQDNGVQRFNGDGVWSLTDYGDGSYVAIDPGNPRIWYDGYVSFSIPHLRPYQFTGFERSDTAGARDSYTRPPGTASINVADRALFYAPFHVVDKGAGNAPDIWVGTEQLYYTDDRGQTFNRIATSVLPPPPPLAPGVTPPLSSGISAIAVAPGHPERVYVGTSQGRLFVVNRPGASWTAVPAAGVAPTPLQTTAAPIQDTIAAAAAAAGLAAPSFISAIAVARLPSGQDRVYVGVGRNHMSGGEAAINNAGLYKSDDGGLTFTLVPLPAVVVPGVPAGVTAARNSVNAVAIDPADPDVAFVGCDIGVFRFDAGTNTLEAWRQRLPNSAVLWLDVYSRAPRLLRAATHGRGVFETLIDAAPAGGCLPADTYLRDMITDAGRDTSPATDVHPFSGNPVTPDKSIDLVLDVTSRRTGAAAQLSTEDFTPTGQLDGIGFIALGNGAEVHKNDIAKLHIRVHNRGPDPATQVKVAVSWADATGTVPNLPNGFFTPFPGAAPATAGGWTSLGPVKTIDRIEPGESRIASYNLPLAGVPDRVRILAVSSSNEDPFVAPANPDSLQAARVSKQLAVYDVDVEGAGSAALIIVLIIVGVAVVGGATYLYLSQRD